MANTKNPGVLWNIDGQGLDATGKANARKNIGLNGITCSETGKFVQSISSDSSGNIQVTMATPPGTTYTQGTGINIVSNQISLKKGTADSTNLYDVMAWDSANGQTVTFGSNRLTCSSTSEHGNVLTLGNTSDNRTSTIRITSNNRATGATTGFTADILAFGLTADRGYVLPDEDGLLATQTGSYPFMAAGRLTSNTHAASSGNTDKYVTIGSYSFDAPSNGGYAGITLSVEIRDSSGNSQTGILWTSPCEFSDPLIKAEYCTISKRQAGKATNVDFYVTTATSDSLYVVTLYAKVHAISQIFVSTVNDPLGKFVYSMEVSSTAPSGAVLEVVEHKHLLRSTYGTAIGSPNTPVYIDVNGDIQVCSISGGQSDSAKSVLNSISGGGGTTRTVSLNVQSASTWGLTCTVLDSNNTITSNSFLESNNLSIHREDKIGDDTHVFDLQLGVHAAMDYADTSTGLLMGYNISTSNVGRLGFFNPDRLYIAKSDTNTDVVTDSTTIKADEISTTGMIRATGYTSAGSESSLITGVDFHGKATSAIKWHDSGTSGAGGTSTGDYVLKVVTSMPATVDRNVIYVI